ncbi:MAG: hypothetical protein ABL864_14015 [Terricaulis sp.]
MAVIDSGVNTPGKVNVTDTFEALVTLPQGTASTAPQTAGFAAPIYERDGGATLGTRTLVKPRVSAQDRASVGQPVPLFQETFNGTAINTALFDTTVTTMTLTVSGGFATLNAGSSTATSAVARLLSRNYFPMPTDFGLVGQAEGVLGVVPQANNTVEIGFFLSSGITGPTDGAFFRFGADASLKAVINNNGSETSSTAITGFSAANTRYVWKIEAEDDSVNFYINGTLVFSHDAPAATGKCWNAESLPFQVRCFNASGGSPASAQQAKIASIYVGLQDAAGWNVLGSHLQAFMGRTGHQGQTGQTMGSTAAMGNSAVPTAAVPTNTTAALTPNGLGGQFYETDTLALGTDGIISSYQNPAGTAAISGKTLMITGVKIESYVQTAISAATGGYNGVWSLAFGHTAVSLATAEAAGTKAARRVPLGQQAVATAAAAGTVLATVTATLQTPIPVLPGEFVQTVRKKVGGVIPTTGVLGHLITIDAYWV